MKEYNDDVDNIGNRYYYIKKNFILILFEEQKSLRQRADDEIQADLYEGTVLDSEKMMGDYSDEDSKFNETKLNDIINNFTNILDRKRIDIVIAEK